MDLLAFLEGSDDEHDEPASPEQPSREQVQKVQPARPASVAKSSSPLPEAQNSVEPAHFFDDDESDLPPPLALSKKQAETIELCDSSDEEAVASTSKRAPTPTLDASRQELEKLDRELQDIDDQMEALTGARRAVQEKRSRLLQTMPRPQAAPSTPRAQLRQVGKIDLSEGSTGSKDYNSGKWQWTDKIKQKLRNIWQLDAFRPLQEGIINASLDKRDIVVVMPTGVRCEMMKSNDAHRPASRSRISCRRCYRTA